MTQSVFQSEFKKGESIGVMIKSNPGSSSYRRGLALVQDALESGCRVFLYLLDEAVAGVEDQELQSIINLGGKVSACAYALEKRAIECPESVIPAGLTMMSDVLLHPDNAFVFN